MSYTDDVKRSLFDATRSHWAEFSGFLRACGSVKGEQFVFWSREATLARYFFVQLKGQGVRAKYLGKHGGYGRFPRHEVVLKDAGSYLRKLHVLNREGELISVIPPQVLEGEVSRRAYLRGLFLGSGSVSDPKKNYHFSFRVDSKSFSESLLSLLLDYEIRASVRRAKQIYYVYTRSAEYISEIFALIGATKALLELEDIRIIKGVRADVNRSVNFETANIAKTIVSSQRQIKCIEALSRRVGLLNLPEDLAEVALLRLEYPEMSLSQIGENLEKPLTKSGVNHRMKRIMALCEEMGEEIS